MVEIHKMSNDKDVLEIHKTFDDPPIFHPHISNPTIQDFDPKIPGVVVTKIQGPPHIRPLRQMLCLFTEAYNNRPNHDIIVFTSEPIEEEDIQELKSLVAPAKLILEIDNPGLQQMVDELSSEQKSHLLERCNAKTSADLSWYSKCEEVRSYTTIKNERVAYNWQAEFRALHLWTHALLTPYKYMLWIDSDAFCTRVWKQDPIAAMERYDLALVRQQNDKKVVRWRRKFSEKYITVTNFPIFLLQ